MHSICGRFHVTFNGEIYNFPEIREQLKAQGRHFQSNSDTEVLLHLYELKGESMAADLRGMFAFAIWDSVKKELFLARDPYGIKPLYYADDGWTFRFASQVKSILAGGRVSRDPEPAGVVGFYLWGSVPDPFTLYRDIRAVPAGHSLKVTIAGPEMPRPYMRISPLALLAAETDPKPVSGYSRVSLLESTQYMKNQLLRDADWAGMAHSLEIRTPFVDIEVLKKLSCVTPFLKGRSGKQALGKSPISPLPEEVTQRAKTGFGVPIGGWLAKLVAEQPSEYATKGSASRGWGRYVLSEQKALTEKMPTSPRAVA